MNNYLGVSPREKLCETPVYAIVATLYATGAWCFQAVSNISTNDVYVAQLWRSDGKLAR